MGINIEPKIVSFDQRWENEVINLWNECCKKDPITVSKFRNQILFDENFDRELCLIALDNECVIGFILAIKRKFPYLERGLEPERGWISVLFVHENYRKQGIASKLIRQIEQKLARLNVKEITLAAYSPNYFFSGIDEENYVEAAALFQKMGYIRLDRHYSMGRTLFDYQIPESIKKSLNEIERNGYRIVPFEYRFSLELLDFLKNEFGGGWKRNALIAMQQNKAEETILMMLDSEKNICGFCMRAMDGNKERFGPIGIAQEKRNKGLGSVLLHVALNKMKEQSLQKMFFMSTDEDGRRYYERNGLILLRTYVDYRKKIV